MRKSLLISCILSFSALSGCASTCRVMPAKVPLPAELVAPPPPPGEFQACMVQVVRYGEGRGQISADCLRLMRLPPTALAPNSVH